MRKTEVAIFSVLFISIAVFSIYSSKNTRSPNNFIGPGSSLEGLLAKLSFVDTALCVGLPDTEEPFDSIDKAKLEGWIPRLRYTTNPQHLSLTIDTENKSSLRQRFVPSSNGSMRVVASIGLRKSQTYEIEQSVQFEPGFQWGSEVESGKFGFGFAGGSAPTGGKLARDGFSARLLWKGHGDGTASAGVYLYTVDRTQNLPYGDEFVFAESTLPIGEWFRVKMRLKTNSSHEEKDGELQVWINDVQMIDRHGIQWHDEGDQPMISQLLYSSFHGGNTSQWSPRNEVYAQFSDICVYKDRPTDTEPLNQ